jgi:signal peptidase II
MKFLKELYNKKILLKKENIYLLFLIILIFFTDQVTKNIIINHYSENIYFINEFINLDLIWNTGIGFGLFSSNSSLIYNLITLLISLVIIFLFFLAIDSERTDKIIFSIIIGGALGNFYDRLIYNAVPDFIDLHYNKFHWFTFNIADILISIGIVLFIIRGFLLKD